MGRTSTPCASPRRPSDSRTTHRCGSRRRCSGHARRSRTSHEGGRMPYTHAERLSALDLSFLELEDANAHMHIGAVAVFDATPVTRPEGGVDIDLIRKLM